MAMLNNQMVYYTDITDILMNCFVARMGFMMAYITGISMDFMWCSLDMQWDFREI